MREKIVEKKDVKTNKWIRTKLRFVKAGNTFRMFIDGKKETLIALKDAYKSINGVWTVRVDD